MAVYLDMTSRKQTNRIEYLDIFRSLGIILMIMGHVGFGEIFSHFIHAFHMPMFFWISGYLFRNNTNEDIVLKNVVIKKMKSLLLPYFIFGILHYLIYMLIQYINQDAISVIPIIHLFSVNTKNLPICGALWFLTALFFADIIFLVIEKYIENKIIKMLIVIAIACIGNISKEIFSFTLPFALSASFVGMGLYYIGYLFKKYENRRFIYFFMNMPWRKNIVLSIITIILIFINGYVNMRKEEYAIIPLFWINAMLSIIVGINYSKLIYLCIQNTIVNKYLMNIGKYSIIYVCLNEIVIMSVGKIVSRMNMSLYLSKILILLISLFVLGEIGRFFLKLKNRGKIKAQSMERSI